MRKELMDHIRTNRDLLSFIRENPQWYRQLSRDPLSYKQFEQSAKKYYKKTFPDRVEKFSNGAQMASFMLNMLQSFQQKE